MGSRHLECSILFIQRLSIRGVVLSGMVLGRVPRNHATQYLRRRSIRDEAPLGPSSRSGLFRPFPWISELRPDLISRDAPATATGIAFKASV